MTLSIEIRLAGSDDAADLASLLIEMQDHYNVPSPAHRVLEGRLRALPDGVEVLLAIIDGRIVGLAAVSAIFPGPGLVGGLFLKELYVATRARGSGVGKALMAAAARLAETKGLGRIDWMVGKDNVEAIRFYDQLGGRALADRHLYRLTGDAFTALSMSGAQVAKP